MDDPTWWCLRLIGRLAPGVTRTQAVAQLQPIFQAAAYIGLGTPGWGKKAGAELVDAKDSRDTRRCTASLCAC